MAVNDIIYQMKGNDGAIAYVRKAHIIYSTVLADMIENDGVSEVPVPMATGVQLDRIFNDFIQHHHNNPTSQPTRAPGIPVGGPVILDEFSKVWCKKLEEESDDVLIDYIRVANALDIRLLLDATTQTIADTLSSLTPEEIRKRYDVPDDFTPEEKAHIQKEMEWLASVQQT